MARTLRRSTSVALATALLSLGLGVAPALAGAESSFVNKTNSARAANGKAPVEVYWDLTDDARAHSKRMMEEDNLYHNPNLGSVTTGWEALGENVGVGPSVDSLFDAFMDSSGHRAIILGNYNYIGVGVSAETESKLWVTMIFMRGPDDLLDPPPTTTTTEPPPSTTTTEPPPSTTTTEPPPSTTTTEPPPSTTTTEPPPSTTTTEPPPSTTTTEPPPSTTTTEPPPSTTTTEPPPSTTTTEPPSSTTTTTKPPTTTTTTTKPPSSTTTTTEPPVEDPPEDPEPKRPFVVEAEEYLALSKDWLPRPSSG